MKIYLLNSLLGSLSLSGKPVYSRVTAFSRYFLSIDIDLEKIDKPTSLTQLIRLFFFTRKIKDNYIFISMPPFRNFWLFLIPGLKVILDIRDGWSIAQNSGYGGNVKKKPLKAKVSRIIERFAIKRSFFTITCTPGLQEYLSKVAGREVLLIPNGISDDDLDLINELKKHQSEKRISDELIFCCAGQFSEYGKNKVKLLLQKIAERYAGWNLSVQLIGSNETSNDWVHDYFKEITAGKGRVETLPRMGKKELFSVMLNADFGLTILRDPSYDMGTKIYDYIALGLPAINYFDTENNFTRYFDACLDIPFNTKSSIPEIRRSVLIESVLSNYFKGYKL